MIKTPLVSVICTCYNQAMYIDKALDSVMSQTYPSIELIVIDDASTDQSAAQIRMWQKAHPAVICIFHIQNQGICASFNEGLRLSKGAYIIDFSGDDLMLPERIATQVAFFQQAPISVGIVYSNILWINAQGKALYPLYRQSPIVPYKTTFELLLAKSFIASPSMMTKRLVYETLGGYNEALAYEDLDFWFRSARQWEYGYQPSILTLVRKSAASFSMRFNQVENPLLLTAYEVCKQTIAKGLFPDEQKALNQRIERYVYRAFFTHHFELVQQLTALLLPPKKYSIQVVTFLATCRLKTNCLFRLYHKLHTQIEYIYQKLYLWKILSHNTPSS